MPSASTHGGYTEAETVEDESAGRMTLGRSQLVSRIPPATDLITYLSFNNDLPTSDTTPYNVQPLLLLGLNESLPLHVTRSLGQLATATPRALVV